jgi:hypothetical protein
VLIIELLVELPPSTEWIRTVSTMLQVPVGDATRNYHLISVTYYNQLEEAFHCHSRAGIGRGFLHYDDTGPLDVAIYRDYPPDGSQRNVPANAFFVLE